MKYKAILFDFDNTLMDYDLSEKSAICDTFTHFGLDLSLHGLFSKVNNELWKMLEKGEISREALKVERFRRILESIGSIIDPCEISEYYLSVIKYKSFSYNFSKPLLKRLSELGYKLYVVTNGSSDIARARFMDSTFKEYISDIFISEEIGASKPNPVFFRAVLESASLNPNECIIVGDSLSSDILGGINSGIDTCWYNAKRLLNAKSYFPTYTVTDMKQLFTVLGEDEWSLNG